MMPLVVYKLTLDSIQCRYCAIFPEFCSVCCSESLLPKSAVESEELPSNVTGDSPNFTSYVTFN